ncbi:MAG: hypothetical protein ACP5FN_03085, partial [Candidatus Micrarchaeia archaeon]
AKLESEIKKIKEDIDEKKKLEELLKGKSLEENNLILEKKNEELERLEKSLAGYASKKEEAERYMQELEEHISKCPVCEREISEELRLRLLESKKEIVKSAESAAEQAKKEIERLRGEIKGLKGTIDKLAIANEKLKGYAGLDAKLSDTSKQLENVDATNKKTSEERIKSQKKLEELQQTFSKLEANKKEMLKLLEYKKEIEEVEKAASAKRKEFEAIKIDSKTIDDAQKELNEITAK